MQDRQPNGTGESAAPDRSDDRWNDKYPPLGIAPIPIEPYISREYFALERERIFRKVWLNVGRIEHIPNPGDYVVVALPVCRLMRSNSWI